MTTFAEILGAALSLPPHQRTELAEALLSTLSDRQVVQVPELTDVWRNEIDRRSAEYDAGQVSTVAWEEVRDRVRRNYQSHASS